MWKLCKLCAQIAFLELIISFYVIHLSAVIVCQSNAVAARYEVECKFYLGSSLLCAKIEGGRTAGFTFTITVMIQSSLIIIPRMSTPIEIWLHTTHTKQLLSSSLQAQQFTPCTASSFQLVQPANSVCHDVSAPCFFCLSCKHANWCTKWINETLHPPPP